MANQRLIVALDFHSLERVKALVESLGDSVSYYKVGMELFYSVGAPAVAYLRERGKDVFLDLKLHDIPNTAAQGLSSLVGLGASLLNVHASGGFTMMKTAAQHLREQAEAMQAERPKLIAVTVLTSIHEEDWQGLGMTSSMQEQVIRLARLAQEAGLDGVVASPLEAKAIRAACGEHFMIVTPGVRPAGSAAGDQSRIATPTFALQNGASHLVVGRPITAAQNPREAALKIIEEMEAVQ